MTESRVTQRLAAILAADVVGYSRLMQDDERATVASLDESRLVFRQHVAAHQGRIVDTAGDSVLAVFETAIGAAQAANQIQKALIDRNAALPEDRRMLFRIGIHLGDVIEKPDGSIYGDGVNIAARLENLAAPGAITVSEDIHRQIRHKVDVVFEDLGEHEVKNIADPVRAYRLADTVGAARSSGVFRRRRAVVALAAAMTVIVAAAGIGWWQLDLLGGVDGISIEDAAQLRPSLPTGPSIAVLPFENLSGDPEQDYFSDGLTEDVIAALGRFSNLTVLTRNSTVRFKGTDRAPEDIGRELGVRYLLIGTVRKAGSRVRVSAQLTDGMSGVQLWSNRYDDEVENLFTMQDEITHEVVGELAAQLTRVERLRAVNKPTKNLDAYDLVLRGLDLLRDDERSKHFRAREMFERAIEIDPDYAAAYTALGEAHHRAVVMGYTEFIDSSIDKAEDLAARALTLDPYSVKALGLLGRVFGHKREYDLAADQLKRALEVNPSDAESYRSYGAVMVWSGHEDQAIEWFEAALRFDADMTWGYTFDLSVAYYLAGRYQDAVATARESQNRSAENWAAPVILAAGYAQLGRTDEAAKAADDVMRLQPFFTMEQFASQFPDPDDVAHIAEGLEKAGLGKPPDQR